MDVERGGLCTGFTLAESIQFSFLKQANSFFHSRHSDEEEVLTQGATYLPLSRGPEEPSCALFSPEEEHVYCS